MLDNKVFLQGINYLKANYLNWQFDLNNDLMLKVWYKKFAALEANTFMALVEKYTEVNKFGPQSPADLLEVLRNELYKKELDPNEAWLYVNQLIAKHGCFWTTYDREAFFKDLENKPALKKTIEQFEKEIQTYKREDNYFPERFKKGYEFNLKGQVEEKSSLLIGANNYLRLE